MAAYWFVFVTIFLVALVQVPIGVDLLRFMFPEWRIARLASRAAQWILFLVMGTIYLIGLGYHLFVYLPLIASDPLHSVSGLLHLLFAVWVWINVVVNYYLAVFVHPSGGKQLDHSNSNKKTDATADATTDRTITAEGSNGLRSRVSNPNQGEDKTSSGNKPPPPKSGTEWKPTRNHSCKICRCEVIYMDHHCPFTGSCVGLNNYSYFFLGLFYGVVGLGYAVAITLPYFYKCNMKNVLWFVGLISSRGMEDICYRLGPHSHIFLPVFVGFCITLNIFMLQVVFVMADVSTYNVLKNWKRYPMFRFMWQRMRSGKCLEPDSRLSVLITNQRRGVLWYLIPARNTGKTSLEQ